MIPIMKPKLPAAASLLPYLMRIDESRWYSNFGKLNEEYEGRLADIFKCSVVSCSSATVGLTAALMDVVPTKGSLIGMPAWTFAATASAIFSAGHLPRINDSIVHKNCGGHVVVLPLGMPIDLGVWEELPTVVDGAAGFDALSQGLCGDIGNVPVVVSTHSTKVFGTGEGGFVLSRDKNLIDRIRKIVNQGMNPDKSVAMVGFNGKLSEYHAAVGLAELDNWGNKREEWLAIQRSYGEQTEYMTSTHSELVPEGVDVNTVVDALATMNIVARASWYGICHLQKAYLAAGATVGDVSRTEELRRRTIFLPKFVGMLPSEIDYVKESFEKVCASQ